MANRKPARDRPGSLGWRRGSYQDGRVCLIGSLTCRKWVSVGDSQIRRACYLLTSRLTRSLLAGPSVVIGHPCTMILGRKVEDWTHLATRCSVIPLKPAMIGLPVSSSARRVGSGQAATQRHPRKPGCLERLNSALWFDVKGPQGNSPSASSCRRFKSVIATSLPFTVTPCLRSRAMARENVSGCMPRRPAISTLSTGRWR